LQLERFDSDDEEILGDLFSEDDSDELVEVNVSQLDRLARLDASPGSLSVWFVRNPLSLLLAPGFCSHL
jgi:hypothetical protein